MLRTAVIGVGYLGRFHAQKHKQLSEQGKVLLQGVLDFDPARAKVVADELGVKAFSSMAELRGQVDAVTVASTTQTHYAIAKEALQSGFHTLVEKPMTVTLPEAEELCRLAKEKNLQLAVGHSERMNPVFQDLVRKYSQPQFLELRRHAPFKLRGSDVSVILDLMIHDLDLALAWCGDLRLQSAAGGMIHSSTVDWAEAELTSPSGTRVNISASRTAAALTRVVRGIQGRHTFWGNFQTMEIEATEWAAGQEAPVQKRQETLAKADHLFLETEAFFAAIQNGQPTGDEGRRVAVTGDEGRRALSLAIEIENRILRK